MPNHLVWNEDTGGYYNPDEFQWDVANQVYIERNKADIASTPIEEQEPVEEWIKKHEKSSSPVDQALIKFYRDKVKNQTPEEMLLSVYLTPSTKKALKHLVDLGPEHVDEMVKRIENNSRWSPALIHAVLEIKGITSPELLDYSLTAEGTQQWVNKFKELSD